MSIATYIMWGSLALFLASNPHKEDSRGVQDAKMVVSILALLFWAGAVVAIIIDIFTK